MSDTSDQTSERIFGYHRGQPHGIPAGFPNAGEVFVLKDIMRKDGERFLRLIDCSGLDYVLLLEFNHDVADCIENTLLQELRRALKANDRRTIAQAAGKCGKLFWPFVMGNYRMRVESGTDTKAIDPLALTRNESYKIRLRTSDGKLQASTHDTELTSGGGWFEKPFADIPSVSRSRVELLEKITYRVFRVKIQGKDYCVKTNFSNTDHLLLQEIEKLHRIPEHPNVVRLSGVLDDGDGKYYGMVIPYFPDGTLSEVQLATASQKSGWKEQISSAVRFLHGLDVVWGDAKPHNIAVDFANNSVVLIDFEGGSDDAWVDRNLADTKGGDIQGVERILHYIDSIPTM